MKIFVLVFIIFIGSVSHLPAQDFTGQWKGDFMDQSTKSLNWGGDKCEYVLDLECKGKKVSGYSYTYFTDGVKKYYTICKLEGILDTRNKYIEVKETERTKTNVPPNIANCFQVHKLTFFRQPDGTETLEGSWMPAPNQKNDCGYGLTSLSRRTLKSNFRVTPALVNSKPHTSSSTRNTGSKKADESARLGLTNISKPHSKSISTVAKQVDTSPVIIADRSPEALKETTTDKIVSRSIERSSRFEKRSNNILRTIEVENSVVKVDLYDNGEVDGDSVSLFLNGKLIMAHKRLTTQPLSINISRDDLENENALVMYADNLGTIPPNTALMIVTDGARRYEIRITSDLQKSGTIIFLKKDK